MKKLLSFTVAAVMGLCFTGCEKKLINSVPIVNTSIDSKVKIEKDGESFNCNLVHTPEGISTVRFISPKNLEGLTFLWENGNYKVEMKELSGEYNLTPWLENSDISYVIKVLDTLNDSETLKSISKDESGQIFKGTAENFEYEVKLDSKNNIMSICVPKIGLKVSFVGN